VWIGLFDSWHSNQRLFALNKEMVPIFAAGYLSKIEINLKRQPVSSFKTTK
jgi:hypothetical protein